MKKLGTHPHTAAGGYILAKYTQREIVCGNGLLTAQRLVIILDNALWKLCHLKRKRNGQEARVSEGDRAKEK